MVSATANPLVAQYSIALPALGTVAVEFSQDTSYPLHTSAQAGTVTGGSVSILVAGMQQNKHFSNRYDSTATRTRHRGNHQQRIGSRSGR